MSYVFEDNKGIWTYRLRFIEKQGTSIESLVRNLSTTVFATSSNSIESIDNGIIANSEIFHPPFTIGPISISLGESFKDNGEDVVPLISLVFSKHPVLH